MKFGVNVNNYYLDFLEETAKLNGITKTKVCSLILENFLSFNKLNHRVPLFRQYVGLVFGNKDNKKVVVDVPSEKELKMSWDEMMDILANVPESVEDQDEFIEKIDSED